MDFIHYALHITTRIKLTYFTAVLLTRKRKLNDFNVKQFQLPKICTFISITRTQISVNHNVHNELGMIILFIRLGSQTLFIYIESNAYVIKLCPSSCSLHTSIHPFFTQMT